MNKTRIEQKNALYIGGIRVSDYIYDDGKVYSDIALMTKGTEVHVFDLSTGSIKFKICNVKKIRYSNDSLIVTSVYGAMGVYDFDGRNIIPVIYKKIYNRGLYYVATKHEKDPCILYKWNEESKKMDVVIPAEKDFIELKLCNEGIITINSSKKYGAYSYGGEELIEAKYDMIEQYGNSYITTLVTNGSRKFGMYTSSGKKVLANTYTRYELDLPLVYLFKGGRWCAYNVYTKKIVAKLKYDNIERYDDIMTVTEGNSSFYVKSATNGHLLFEYSFDKVNVHKHKIILLETTKRCSWYYLPIIKKFINADLYNVKYVDGKYYIKDVFDASGNLVNNEWEILQKDKQY